MGKVIAVCTSDRKGIQKKDVSTAHFSAEWGIDGDAHAGKWHRQISLLSADKIEAFNKRGANVIPGAFGENLVVEGFDFRALPVGTLLRCNDVLLEMTQIGKECHSHCEIYKKMGDCIMPREGVFARVLEPGTISVGDEMTIVPREGHFPWQAAVITLGESGSGEAISKRLRDAGYTVVEEPAIPDDARVLKQQLIRLCDQRRLDIILVTGGAGSAAQEAMSAVSDKPAPSIASAVIRGKTLIAADPEEHMDALMDSAPQVMESLRNGR